MAFQSFVLFFASIIIAVSGQQKPETGDCLTQCTNALYQSGARLDPVSMLNIETIQLADGTAVYCPRMNDSMRLEKSCGPYRTARQCIDQCPQSDSKTTLINSFGGLQFMCIDRIDDWKGYTPCLSEHCEEIQSACSPKCGSFGFIIQQVVRVLQQANYQYAQGNSSAIDVNKFSKVFGESCSRLYCFNDCSRNMTTNYCGNGALSLAEDIQWTTLSSMFYSLRQWGIDLEWPNECKTLSYYLRKRI